MISFLYYDYILDYLRSHVVLYVFLERATIYFLHWATQYRVTLWPLNVNIEFAQKKEAENG